MPITIDQIKEDIQKLFGDTSRPVSETRSDLEEIAAHCEMLAETLPDED